MVLKIKISKTLSLPESLYGCLSRSREKEKKGRGETIVLALI
jgi:hypothetical protein